MARRPRAVAAGGARRRRADGHGDVAAVPVARAARRRPRPGRAPRRGDGRVHRVLRPRVSGSARRSPGSSPRSRAATTRRRSTSAARSASRGAFLGWFSTRGIPRRAGARVTRTALDLPPRRRHERRLPRGRARGRLRDRGVDAGRAARSRRGRSTSYAALIVLGGDQNVCEQDRFPYLTARARAAARLAARAAGPCSASASARSCSRRPRAARSCARAQRELGWLDVDLLPAARRRPAAGIRARRASRRCSGTATRSSRRPARPCSRAARSARRRSASARHGACSSTPRSTRAILDGWLGDLDRRRARAGRATPRCSRPASRRTWTAGTPSAASCCAGLRRV